MRQEPKTQHTGLNNRQNGGRPKELLYVLKEYRICDVDGLSSFLGDCRRHLCLFLLWEGSLCVLFSLISCSEGTRAGKSPRERGVATENTA